MPERNPVAHGRKLRRELEFAIAHSRNASARAVEKGLDVPGGYYFQSVLDARFAGTLGRLENLAGRNHVELASVVSLRNNRLRAVVHVPEQRHDFLQRKLDQYVEPRELDEGGEVLPPRNNSLFAPMEKVLPVRPQSLFTDRRKLFPKPKERTWFEVWLWNDPLLSQRFEVACEVLGLRAGKREVAFVERVVRTVRATPRELELLINGTQAVAELRLAAAPPKFFAEMGPKAMDEWSDDLRERTIPPSSEAAAVCILDSGSTPSHPLLSDLLEVADMHSWDGLSEPFDKAKRWAGHGTKMTGMVAYGDLAEALSSNDHLQVPAVLETVKVLPDKIVKKDTLELSADRIREGVSRVEVAQPTRSRLFCLATTTPAGTDQGRPSSSSAMVDELAYDDGGKGRLFVLAAGNIRSYYPAGEYLVQNDARPIEDPGQSWNALVVGSTTVLPTSNKDLPSGWLPLAEKGDLSPRSRTSVSWDHSWPLKPDVVMEGGNALRSSDDEHFDDPLEVKMLGLHRQHDLQMFAPFSDTSASAALVARMAGAIMTERPDLSPQTVRGLIVHSARWTSRMKRHLPKDPKQKHRHVLMRRYGYGVPDLGRALRSTRSDVTLIVEGTIKPPYKTNTKGVLLDLHDLPWPSDRLRDLPEEDARIRITLSYFVEPNPGANGGFKRHDYPSHGLRFDLKRPDETRDAFRKRINAAARAGEKAARDKGTERWRLGPKLRDRGSLHSDAWKGSVAEVLGRGTVAVFPVSGWWKHAKRAEDAPDSVRYSLIVSVEVNADIDIHTEIATKAGIEVPTAIEVR